MRNFFKLVSAIAHPLFMPLACIYLGSQYDWYVRGLTDPSNMKLVYFVVALSTIIFPALNIILLKWNGVVNSLEMPTRKERYLPFLSTAFFFCLGYYMLRKAELPNTLYSIFFGSIIGLVLIMLINFKWKISAHATGAFGLVGTTVALFQVHHFGNVPLLCLVLAIGALVLTSRLYLKAHTPAQVYAGAILGFVTLFITVATRFFI